MKCKKGKPHFRPVHFMCRGGTSFWACVECGRQISGKKLLVKELKALVLFAKYAGDYEKNKIQAPNTRVTEPKAQKEGKMKEFSLTMQFEGHASNADIADALRVRANLIEGMDAKKAMKGGKVKAAVEEAGDEAEEVEEAEAEEESDFVQPKKKAKKKAAADFEEESEAEEESEEETEEEAQNEEEAEEPPPKKKTAAKAKGPSIDDVNDACKARARKTSFDETKALLLKKFGTSSVVKLKPDQYAAVIALMTGKK